MNVFNSSHFGLIGFMRIACSVPSAQRLGTAKAGCLALVGLLWFGALVLRAADHYVRTPETCGNTTSQYPYTSWEDAATNIQWAVNAATNTETVWVSNGVYVLTNQIVITNGIILRSTNGPAVTIINGNFAVGNPETNRCLFMSNASAFVHGFTISNGASCAPLNSYQNGGGVWISAGTLSNCTVRNNTVFAPTDTPYVGGGGIAVYNQGGTVTACRVTDNLVTNFIMTGLGSGGGIWVQSGGCGIFDCLVSNNVIKGGGASTRGGGIDTLTCRLIKSSMICNNYNQNGFGGGIYVDNVIMDACTVTVNQANYSGGCHFQRGTITNCVISYNSGSRGSGLQITPEYASYASRIFNTTIYGNTGETVRLNAGAGMTLMTDCVITGNNGAAVTMYTTNDNLFNCVVRGNTSAVAVTCRNGTIRNCLIAGNYNGGLLIYSTCSTALVSSCTIVNNRSASSGSGIRFEATNAPSERLISISSCIISSNGVDGADDVYDNYAPTNYGAFQYSCIGSNRGFTGAGLITNQQPQFVDFAGGNYRLGAGSPCINTGSNEPSWMTNAFDLDGRTRIRYGTVDMGAYERINEGTIYGFH